MTVSAPPHSSSPAPEAPESKPLEREIEALVEALIEEARRETRRRHRRYWAFAAFAALVGAGVLILLDGGAASQTASTPVSARTNAPVQAPMARLAFTSTTRDLANRNVPNPPPPKPVIAELYVVNADGSDKRLLKHREYIGYPDYGSGVAWSPDGQTIAFAVYARLLFVNADGSGQRDVTRELRLGQLPVWSPDGRRIALFKCRGGQRCDIYVMNADGTGLRRLTRNRGSGFPLWSPNGKKIAFLRGYPPGVWVMNADGSGQRRLARVPGVPSAWSPEGRRLAFVSLAGARDRMSEIYVVNEDGSGQRRLTHNAVNEWTPRWSPDGKKILFARARSGTRGKVSDIYVINADGSGQRKLTERGNDARWSPDGTKISFVTNRDGNKEIYVMNADGSEQVNVSQSALTDETSHVWSPAQTK
jgi:TolB protein